LHPLATCAGRLEFSNGDSIDFEKSGNLSQQFDEQYNQRDADNDLAVHPRPALSALDECHPRVVVTSIPEALRCYRTPPQARVGGKCLDARRLVHVLTLEWRE
jgi:hypothetical protein